MHEEGWNRNVLPAKKGSQVHSAKKRP